MRCTGLSGSWRIDTAARPPSTPQNLDIQLGDRVIANGEDVTEAIRAPEVSEAASMVATNPAVREALVQKQRELRARATGWPRDETSAPWWPPMLR